MAKKKKLDPQTERRKEVEEFLIAQYEDYPHMADPVNPTGGGGGGTLVFGRYRHANHASHCVIGFPSQSERIRVGSGKQYVRGVQPGGLPQFLASFTKASTHTGGGSTPGINSRMANHSISGASRFSYSEDRPDIWIPGLLNFRGKSKSCPGPGLFRRGRRHPNTGIHRCMHTWDAPGHSPAGSVLDPGFDTNAHSGACKLGHTRNLVTG